jgi:LEA14-like dessication related protein
MASGSFIGRHPILSILLLLLLLFIGYIVVVLVDEQPPIVADVETMRISAGQIRQDSVSANVSIKVKNRLPIPLRMDSLRYTLAIAGDTLIRGVHKEPITIGALTGGEITVPILAAHQQLLQKLDELEGASATLNAVLNPYTSFWFAGPFTIPVTFSRIMQIPSLPKVEIAEIISDSLGPQGGVLRVRLRIQNDNPFPLSVNGFSYQFKLDRIVISDSVGISYDMRQVGANIITIPVEISYQQLGEVAMRMLFQPATTTYQLTGLLHLEAENQTIGRIDLPVEEKGTVADITNRLIGSQQ